MQFARGCSLHSVTYRLRSTSSTKLCIATLLAYAHPLFNRGCKKLNFVDPFSTRAKLSYQNQTIQLVDIIQIPHYTA